MKGRTIKWVSKSRGRYQLSIEWELGIGDTGYVPEQVTYDEISDLSKDSTLKDKFLSDPEFVFTLETYGNGTPDPNLLPKEVDITQTVGLLVDKDDLLNYQLLII